MDIWTCAICGDLPGVMGHLQRGGDVNSLGLPRIDGVLHGVELSGPTLQPRLKGLDTALTDEQRERYMATPLLLASFSGHLEIVAQLLQAGARADLPSGCGLLADLAAFMCGHFSVEQLLSPEQAHNRAGVMSSLMSAERTQRQQLLMQGLHGMLWGVLVEEKEAAHRQHLLAAQRAAHRGITGMEARMRPPALRHLRQRQRFREEEFAAREALRAAERQDLAAVV
eukprot:RCo022454